MTINPDKLALYEPDKKLKEKIENINLKEKILFKKETDFHSIFVVENNIGRFIKFNDTYQAGCINTPFYKGNLPYINYFLIPYLMKKDIKNILFIGLGSGIVINQYDKIFNSIKTIDIVDIEEYMFPLAQKYFDFKINEKMNFYLQDALVYLKSKNKKYDLIIADVAGNIGIDERFCNDEYLSLIKKRLKKNGIFISNMPSSRDIFNKKNKFALNLIKLYKNKFKKVLLFNGETSNRIFYKTFFDIDEIVYDVTNLIFISSDKEYKIMPTEKIEKINLKIKDYLDDLVI